MNVDGAMALVILERAPPRGQKVAEQIGGAYAEVDVTDSDDVAAALRYASTLGPVRVALNCAAIADSARILDRAGAPHDLGLFQRIIAVSLVGTFKVSRLPAAALADLDRPTTENTTPWSTPHR